MTQASQWYRVLLRETLSHEVTVLNGILAIQNSIADSSTTSLPILDLIAGDCWV